VTVSELPPRLVRRLEQLHGRRPLCTGSLATVCYPERHLDELRARSFPGVLGCVSPAGFPLVDFERGAIAACYSTEYQGLSSGGQEAFLAWHRGFAAERQAGLFFRERTRRPADCSVWTEILTACADPFSVQRQGTGGQSPPRARRFGPESDA